MTRIAILAALPGELKPLVRNWLHEPAAGVELWRRPYKNGEWVAACAGMGAAAARRAYLAAEAAAPIDVAVSIGWAGALTPDYRPGEVCWLSGVIDARTRLRYPTAHTTHSRWLATSPIVAGHQEKLRLAREFQADLVDMEAAAVADLAQQHGIPFYCLKGVSDALDARLPDFAPFIGPGGQLRLPRFVAHMAVRPSYWPALIRMGENSKEAARRMASVLAEFLTVQSGLENELQNEKPTE